MARTQAPDASDTAAAPYRSEWVGGDLRSRRNPLPLAELVGVGQRAVTETVARGPNAADRAVDPVHHGARTPSTHRRASGSESSAPFDFFMIHPPGHGQATMQAR